MTLLLYSLDDNIDKRVPQIEDNYNMESASDNIKPGTSAFLVT